MDSSDALTRSPARSQFTIVPKKNCIRTFLKQPARRRESRQVEADKENAEYQERREGSTGQQTDGTVTAYASFVSHMTSPDTLGLSTNSKHLGSSEEKPSNADPSHALPRISPFIAFKKIRFRLIGAIESNAVSESDSPSLL